MNSVVQQCESLTKKDITFLEKIGADLGILADLARADVLMYCLCAPERAMIVAQIRPHSILPIYSESLVGRQVNAIEEPDVFRALAEGRRGLTEVRRQIGSLSTSAKTAPIVQETYPVHARDGRIVAAVAVETNLIERERHQRRSKEFRRALKLFRHSVLAGELRSADHLTPFAEHDGILVVDAQRRIQYVSGIATSLYRKLGYAGELLKQRIEDLELDDNGLVLDALEQARCLQGEVRVGNLVWIKKVIPLFERRSRLRRLLFPGEPARRLDGVLLAIHDETDRRRQAEEIQVKVAMIQEIHHRVKNNMQTIASLLRLQSRRSESEEIRRALQEGINRILSVAVIHEFLAHQEAHPRRQPADHQPGPGGHPGWRAHHRPGSTRPQHLSAHAAGHCLCPGHQRVAPECPGAWLRSPGGGHCHRRLARRWGADHHLGRGRRSGASRAVRSLAHR